MIRYTFRLNDYRSVLKGFAKLFHLKIHKKRLIMPPHMGKGYVYASNISRDISFIILNFSLLDDMTLTRKKTAGYGLALSFNQIEIGDFVKYSEQDGSVIDNSPRMHNIFLSSTNSELELVFSRNTALKMVVILFSPAMIKKSVKKDILLDLKLYTDKGLQNMYREPITFEYRQILNEIFDADFDSPVSNLVLHNRILMLTEKFLTSFLEKKSARTSSSGRKLREKDLLALQEVEGILAQASLEKFPSIEVLSKTAKMSSTKLKAKFKSVYGMKLYEYYNRNRLEKARELLQSGKYAVKEVGMEIGFSNLSNFAKAFRKEFGILPNEMLRKE